MHYNFNKLGYFILVCGLDKGSNSEQLISTAENTVPLLYKSTFTQKKISVVQIKKFGAHQFQ